MRGGGGGPRIESPLPHGPSDWRAPLRFSQETPVRSGGGGGPDSDPRRGWAMAEISDLDRQIEQLRRCELIKESEVKALCAKAR